jgi:hypothetical protein
MLGNWGYRHTLGICRNYCFSTAIMITLRPLNVTFIRTLPALFEHSINIISYIHVSKRNFRSSVRRRCVNGYFFSNVTRWMVVSKRQELIVQSRSITPHKNREISYKACESLIQCQRLCTSDTTKFYCNWTARAEWWAGSKLYFRVNGVSPAPDVQIFLLQSV